ncbi:peroxiredoxin [Amaricoccus macauensis]|uniref:Glutathione-dependent peroxiredoxin n=1 Tax=Amaricoccus macauensis TaxID=57001 RepID=A0A840SNX1_9RHOB|nr:peroxiredoxin [Amaricoccus macauensis]MBB5221556.1 peroxiredoxin [Amaricoccus macauensis]
MTIAMGEKLPEATLLEMTDAGLAPVSVSELTSGRNVVIFGLPGAYTGTCSTKHLPSFMRVADQLRAKGVDDIVCVSVNDPFVMKAWGEGAGADKAGIRMLADAASELTGALGLRFSRAEAGFYDRSKRYAMYVVDGEVKVLNLEANPGECDISGGETMLAAI